MTESSLAGPRTWQLLTAIGLLGLVCELGWQAMYAVASPARALVFVALAVCIGNPLRALALGAARANSFTACFCAGFVGMASLYMVMRAARAPRLLILLCLLGLAAWGVWRGRWRTLLMHRADTVSIFVWGLVCMMCARAEWFSELPQLTLRHPTLFAGIDTPLWLNLAYGLERSVPPRELLFNHELLNYHWGAGLLPLLVRATTALPMHVAHTVSVVIAGVATALLTAQVTQRLFAADRGARRMLGWLMPVLACIWLQLWVFNLPSVVGNLLLTYALLELLRASHWRSLALTFPALLLLMLTKEVANVAALLCAGCIASGALLGRRDGKPLARLLLLFVATRLLYTPLTHRNQRVTTTLFREHLDAGWLWRELGRASIVDNKEVLATWLLAAAAVILPLLLWRRHFRDSAVLTGSTFVLTVMMALALLVRPEFSPPLDPLHAHWALVDMYQFYRLGGHIASLALLATLLVASSRWKISQTLARSFAPALAVALAWWADEYYFRIQPPGPGQQYEEYRGDNEIVPVLARIPVRALIASDQLNWNGENPHWAGFFGHNFYCLRRVRWAPAYARFAEVTAKQDAIFSARDIQEVASLAHAESITHVIVDKLRPTPWSTQAPPAFETARHAVYKF